MNHALELLHGSRHNLQQASTWEVFISHPNWRGSAIGIYRSWRDLGYGIGGLGMGIVASSLGTLESGFWFVAGAMGVSGFVLWWLGEETHPRMNPA